MAKILGVVASAGVRGAKGSRGEGARIGAFVRAKLPPLPDYQIGKGWKLWQAVEGGL